jgi:hypothetical protein
MIRNLVRCACSRDGDRDGRSLAEAYVELTASKGRVTPAFLLAETGRMVEDIEDAARAVIAPEHPAGM